MKCLIICFLLVVPFFAFAHEDEEKILSLKNVYLEHAHPAYWEPGDSKYFFPIAAEIFYGFRKLEGYKIKVSENCRKNIIVQKFKAESHRKARYALKCKPNGNKEKAFVFTLSSRNFGQEEDYHDVVLGTSFEYSPNVSLEKIGFKEYLLNITEPSE